MKALDDLMHRCRHDSHTPTYADLVELRQQLAARVPNGVKVWVLVDKDGSPQTWHTPSFVGPETESMIDHLNRGFPEGAPFRSVMLAAATQPVSQHEQPAISAGKVLVPLRMNAEMERVAQEEGWSWADMLAAAEATTLEQDAIARGCEPEPEQQVVQGEPVMDVASTWWSLVMGAAAAIEDASNCLRDEDAKRSAIGSAKHYRERANALFTHPQPDRVALTDEQMREKFEELLEGSLFKRRADNSNEYWDGNVQDDWNLFRDAAKFAEAAHGIKGAQQ